MTQAIAQPIIYETRETWEDSRKGNIGASEVATIVGANPFQSPHSLWCEKVGLLPPKDTTIAMRRGHAMEPFAAELYTEKTGEAVYDPGEFAVWTHPEMPFLRCTPDRLTVVHDKPVELKDIGHNVAKAMSEGEPPLGYLCQVQCQMAVLEKESADLGCVIDGRDFEVFSFNRDDRFIKAMLAEVAEFHERMLSGDPPPVDGHPSTAAAIAALHPDDNGETVMLSKEAIEAVMLRDIAKARMKDIEEEIRRHENVIKAEIGDATFGEGPGIRFSWKTQERAGYLKVADMPDVRERLARLAICYTTTAGSKFRVLRPVKAKA